ncbi:unnamed protein product [Durusdinium trenchii]|uniref:Uncharacterized protein n=1 Tax=Durusdinium trenchii TaxID=1381693 RepID=A0ABP0K2J3_9DINO
MPDLRGQRQMKNITVEADLISYNSAISACREDAWPYALHLMAVAETDSQQLDVISYSSAVCACETACEWQSAWLLLQTVRQKRLINVIALNSFLSTLARAGQWELALWLIYRERPVKLDVISYSSGINACQKSSSWQHGLFLLQDANGRQLHLSLGMNLALAQMSKDNWLQQAHTPVGWGMSFVRMSQERCQLQCRPQHLWPFGMAYGPGSSTTFGQFPTPTQRGLIQRSCGITFKQLEMVVRFSLAEPSCSRGSA